MLILDYFKQGYAEQITPEVEKITGRAPIRFEQYVRDYRNVWV